MSIKIAVSQGRKAVRVLLATLFLGAIFAGTARAEAQDAAMEAHQSGKDIVETAIDAGQFTTLVTALKAAGLVDTLKGPGPYTVFAPTDAAFAKIPADKLQALLDDKEALTRVLLYHVVPGRYMASDVAAMEMADTAEGAELPVKSDKSGVSVGSAKVVGADIVASNGVIHVIDTVLIPR